jgi:membrane protease YdiL (CAAX protease family)
MAVLRQTSAKHERRTQTIRAAELCLVPLSNDLVALITWRYGLDLFPVLAAMLYSYVGMRHLRVLGLEFHWSWQSVRLALMAGLLLAVPSMLIFVHPILVGRVTAGPVTPVTVSAINGLLRTVLIDLPVLTAIIEELVFREFLYFESSSLLRTLVLNSLLFTVWHGVAAFTTVQGTSFGRNPGLLLLSYAGALGSVFVGGVVFAFVRYRTGSFVYSALTHRLTDSTILVALFGVTHFGW